MTADRQGIEAADDPARPQVPADPPVVLGYAERPARPRFTWVWCHFFRNAFVLAGAVSVIGCLVDFPHQGSWVVGVLVCYATAIGFHVWHASVCTADRDA